MKNILAIASIIFVCGFTNAQLISGDVVNEGRKLAAPSDFLMYEMSEGIIYYELAINRVGKVTGARFLSDKSTKISTPIEVRARKYAMQLQFEPGTYYPEFHHCVVRINIAKKKAE